MLKEVVLEVANAQESVIEAKEQLFKLVAFKSVHSKHAAERDINAAVQAAIREYQGLLELYGIGGNKKSVVEPIEDEDDALMVATARVRMGVLWGRMHMIPKEEAENNDVDEMRNEKRWWIEKSIENFSIVEACYSQLPEFEDSLDFVKQMLPLLHEAVSATTLTAHATASIATLAPSTSTGRPTGTTAHDDCLIGRVKKLRLESRPRNASQSKEQKKKEKDKENQRKKEEKEKVVESKKRKKEEETRIKESNKKVKRNAKKAVEDVVEEGTDEVADEEHVLL
ncbi:UNVERIFIED_CONTAM: hypothetical protein HDU68_008390 [Siphonaria sp. JEL0065]|nr:hypothetical protein HDU68_008390 [Siphonaria sp. JEL0065]